MIDGYSPASEFLCSFFGDDEVPLQGSPLAEANLALLIRLTRDPVYANRDWATFLLSQSAVDTPVVRTALIRAVQENDDIVRDEALSGLALRDAELARPLILQALRTEHASVPLFEAAELCAHPSLIEELRAWAQPSSDSYVDQCAVDALAACEAAASE